MFSSGCALAPGASFVPGTTTEAQVRASMGAPSKTYPWTGGGVSWAYPTGPMGQQTHMARFNDKGVLVKFEQVLDQDFFSQIQRGWDGAQVAALIGPPSREERFDNISQVAWDYRFEDTWGYVSIMSVLFNLEGKVVGTFARRLYDGNHRN
jgi:hypothetical protein